MKLSEWMKKNGWTDETLAPQVEADRTTISKIRRGKRRPSPDLALRLFEFSRHKVELEQLLRTAA